MRGHHDRPGTSCGCGGCGGRGAVPASKSAAGASGQKKIAGEPRRVLLQSSRLRGHRGLCGALNRLYRASTTSQTIASHHSGFRINHNITPTSFHREFRYRQPHWEFDCAIGYTKPSLSTSYIFERPIRYMKCGTPRDVRPPCFPSRPSLARPGRALAGARFPSRFASWRPHGGCAPCGAVPPWP
jgi:hypothetical protein